MKIKIDRFTIRIIPENEQDVAFIVDTMKLGVDGAEIQLERIDATEEPMGFRLETDITPFCANYSNNREQTKRSKDELFQRPLTDFIDSQGSWEGPPYSRTGASGHIESDDVQGSEGSNDQNTKVDNENV